MKSIIGVGLGDISSLSLEALDELANARDLILQTVEVPLAAQLEARGMAFSSLDGFYESAEDFDDLNARAAQFVLAREDAALCVLGSVADSTLAAAVLAGAEEPVRILPGQSFCEAARSLCAGRLSSTAPARCYTATQFLAQPRFSVHGPVAICEVDTPYKAADIALRLMEVYPEEQTVFLVRGAAVDELPLCELPRRERFDYATTLVLDEPEFLAKTGYDFEDLIDVIARLRAPGGCPWDREQTHASLRSSLLEESYEVIDAIDRDDPFAMEDELGDLLLQVVFHAQLGHEHSEFEMTGVTDGICRKMIRRHPHVFGTARAETSADVLDNWEKIKRREKGLDSVSAAMDEIPRGMSALLRAKKVQKKAAGVGFDWPDWQGAMEKIAEEAGEVREELAAGRDPEGECGDLLFAAVNLLRLLHVDGDTALHRATEKFLARFALMEEMAAREGASLPELDLAAQEALWRRAKVKVL